MANGCSAVVALPHGGACTRIVRGTVAAISACLRTNRCGAVWVEPPRLASTSVWRHAHTVTTLLDAKGREAVCTRISRNARACIWASANLSGAARSGAKRSGAVRRAPALFARTLLRTYTNATSLTCHAANGRNLSNQVVAGVCNIEELCLCEAGIEESCYACGTAKTRTKGRSTIFVTTWSPL